MSRQEVNPIKRLEPGYYAFSNRGRVVELEIIRYGKDFQALFTMSGLGPNEEKEVIVREKGNVGADVFSAIKGLRREIRSNFEIIEEFAREKAEREDRIAEAEARVRAYRRARSMTSRTGEIPAEYVLFKSDRM